MDPPLEGTGAEALDRVREQARIQLEGRARSTARCTSCCCPRPDDADRSRAWPRLAAAALAGDLFFDIEGDPYALDDGLDYLFGVLDRDGDFHAILVARRRRRVHARR